jgi:hypothetical protein
MVKSLRGGILASSTPDFSLPHPAGMSGAEALA